MREILFRGKGIDNGEWMAGDLLRAKHYANDIDHHFIFTNAEAFPANEFVGYEEVLPETVGQFTGLTDKNGKRIFEGDILDYWSSYTESLCGSYETVVFGVDNCSCCHAVYGWSTANKFGYGRYIDNPEECVVVGNIHDNPELLEG